MHIQKSAQRRPFLSSLTNFPAYLSSLSLSFSIFYPEEVYVLSVCLKISPLILNVPIGLSVVSCSQVLRPRMCIKVGFSQFSNSGSYNNLNHTVMKSWLILAVVTQTSKNKVSNSVFVWEWEVLWFYHEMMLWHILQLTVTIWFSGMLWIRTGPRFKLSSLYW